MLLFFLLATMYVCMFVCNSPTAQQCSPLCQIQTFIHSFLIVSFFLFGLLLLLCFSFLHLVWLQLLLFESIFSVLFCFEVCFDGLHEKSIFDLVKCKFRTHESSLFGGVLCSSSLRWCSCLVFAGNVLQSLPIIATISSKNTNNKNANNYFFFHCQHQTYAEVLHSFHPYRAQHQLWYLSVQPFNRFFCKSTKNKKDNNNDRLSAWACA